MMDELPDLLLPGLGEKLGKVVLPRVISRVILKPSKLSKSQFQFQGMMISLRTQPIR